MKRVIIIGAGFGGLAAAAELAFKGLETMILEAGTYPGGSAGTFYHKGFRFDAGATLAGGFAQGAPLQTLADRYGIDWQAVPDSKAMIVQLPDGSKITRWVEDEHWRAERITQFGTAAENFWNWQENTADAVWILAKKHPPWPPQSINDLVKLTRSGVDWLETFASHHSAQTFLTIMADSFRPASVHIPPNSERLKLFLDAQLMISAQATSNSANALYSAAALDLARQGVSHVPGGMGGMAEKLVQAVERFGGQVFYRQEAVRVIRQNDNTFQIQTRQKESFIADAVIFNLPPWNIFALLGENSPSRFRKLPERPRKGWGAFTVYAGLDGRAVPNDLPLHHQVITGEPLGEGNSIFLSLSPAWDETRAPDGKRALTISTHTKLDPWWVLKNRDHGAYEDRKSEYKDKLLRAAESALPGIRRMVEMVLPGTPVTFERFTKRKSGWVGGFPQTSLFESWGPRIGRGLWIVGDSIFPGQSVPGVSLGGLRVARSVLDELSSSSEQILIKFDRTNALRTVGKGF